MCINEKAVWVVWTFVSSWWSWEWRESHFLLNALFPNTKQEMIRGRKTCLSWVVHMGTCIFLKRYWGLQTSQVVCIMNKRLFISACFTLKKNFFLESCLFFAGLGLCCCTQALSSWSDRGLLCSCGAWTSPRCSFSCCGAQALGAQASAMATHALSRSWRVDSPQTGGQTHDPRTGRQVLIQGTAKEVLALYF